jgi:hypothetical protein
MFTMGSLYAAGAVHANYGAARWVVVATIFLFTVIFSATWGVCFRVYISEIQSPKTRAGAVSLALSANWVVNWIIAFTTPIFLARSTYGVYFFFGTATLLTVVVCVFFMPETRGKSLEDIDASFRGHKSLPFRGEGVIELRSVENADAESNMDQVRFTTSVKT